MKIWVVFEFRSNDPSSQVMQRAFYTEEAADEYAVHLQATTDDKYASFECYGVELEEAKGEMKIVAPAPEMVRRALRCVIDALNAPVPAYCNVVYLVRNGVTTQHVVYLMGVGDPFVKIGKGGRERYFLRTASDAHITLGGPQTRLEFVV